MTTNLDHIVIGAATCQQGVDYLRELLGIEIPVGGTHPRMGTHNHLMQLGNEVFLEIIAINPDGAPPQHPRWYGLDDPFIQETLRQRPRLLTWVVNTNDLSTLQAQTSFGFGQAMPLSRGELTWDFAVPEDGRLLASGMLPYLIQWHTARHPSGRMADTGCRLVKLAIHHPYPSWLATILSEIGARELVEIHALAQGSSAPFLAVHLDTPTGVKVLDSRA